MLTKSTQIYLCRVDGLYDQNQYISFAIVLCLIPKMFTGACENNGNCSGITLPYHDFYKCSTSRAHKNNVK